MQTYGKRGPQQQYRQLCYNCIYSSYFFSVYLYKQCLYMVCIQYYVACMHRTGCKWKARENKGMISLLSTEATELLWKVKTMLHIYLRW